MLQHARLQLEPGGSPDKQEHAGLPRDTFAYAAAKRGLASYFQSLRHRLADTGVVAQFFIIGYMSSQQSFGKKLLLPVVTPEAVAARVLAAVRLERPLTAHLPSFWWAVEAMIRILPWRIFNRMKA